MKEIVVISGKGGTGKTSIVGCFAALAQNAVLADCDVDAADLHLILKPDIKETHDFSGGKQARIIADKCKGCGKCAEVCKFDAIALDSATQKYTVKKTGCEGCGVCRYFCPVDAIAFANAVNGQWFISETRFGTLAHAKLGPGEENSGKLVTLLRKKAKEIAQQQDKDLIIVDGSPGIGCPVIASITGADLALIVTEPTMSGLHDLKRVASLAVQMNVPAAVCVNKYDINKSNTKKIEEYANANQITLTEKIAYSNDFTAAQIQAESICEYTTNGSAEHVRNLWQKTLKILEQKE
ncbi:MAG: ATP-binding protein [Sedimentisphaerales bacterium]|nr:ATP-binding protein [Sedimentisphaerales bacterium]